MYEIKTLIDGLAFAEGPKWRDGLLYLSDFYTYRVLAVAMNGAVEVVAHVPAQPSGTGFLPDGRLLIVSMLDRKILRREVDGSIVQHADLSNLVRWPLNDMVVDYEGRAWVGNFGFDLTGGAPVSSSALICVDPNGKASVAAQELGFPNGMVMTPDGGTLIVAESTMNRLSAFKVHDGQLGERRTWASFGAPFSSTSFAEIFAKSDVGADGICLDAEGAVWVTDPEHRRMLRVAEGGKILEEIKTSEGVFACALGGEDGHTLFACFAPTYNQAEATAKLGASIRMTRVAIPHAGLP